VFESLYYVILFSQRLPDPSREDNTVQNGDHMGGGAIYVCKEVLRFPSQEVKDREDTDDHDGGVSGNMLLTRFLSVLS